MKTHAITFDGEDFEVADGFTQWNAPSTGHQFGNPWERFCCNVVCGEIAPDKTFLDVGANLGAYPLLAAKRTGGNVFAFEPEQDNYRVLCQNVAKFPNVHTYNSALGKSDGYGYLAINTEGNIGAHKVCGYEQTGIPKGFLNTIQVAIRRSDSVAKDLSTKFDIVKIDVEGHAASVLIGGKNTFRESSIILVEYHELCSFTRTPTWETIVPDLLRNLGFAVSNVVLTLMAGETPWRRIGGFVGAKDLSVIEKYLKGENVSC